MYALHNDGVMLDLGSFKDRVTLRKFISSIAADAGSTQNREEFDITAKFLLKNPYIVRILKTDCLWLRPSDLNQILNSPKCIFWEPSTLNWDTLTSQCLSAADLSVIRLVSHAVIHDDEYGFLSIPDGIYSDGILMAFKNCVIKILEDSISGHICDDYTGDIPLEYST